MAIPHFLVIPYPILGHVNPLINLSQILAKHGCKITFLNTDFSHKRLITGSGLDNLKGLGIKFVTLPDGLDPQDDRSDQKKVVQSIKTNMPSMLPKFIEDVNALDVNSKITCIVVTLSMTWALKVGHNLGIKGSILWPASATSLSLCDCIPRLIHDGIIDSYGEDNIFLHYSCYTLQYLYVKSLRFKLLMRGCFIGFYFLALKESPSKDKKLNSPQRCL